jgi:hypothetical protein
MDAAELACRCLKVPRDLSDFAGVPDDAIAWRNSERKGEVPGVLAYSASTADRNRYQRDRSIPYERNVVAGLSAARRSFRYPATGPNLVLTTDPGPHANEWHRRFYNRAVNGGLIPRT